MTEILAQGNQIVSKKKKKDEDTFSSHTGNRTRAAWELVVTSPLHKPFIVFLLCCFVSGDVTFVSIADYVSDKTTLK